METYLESAMDVEITKERAILELKKHCITSAEDLNLFFSEMGNKETYDAYEVLRWLGY